MTQETLASICGRCFYCYIPYCGPSSYGPRYIKVVFRAKEEPSIDLAIGVYVAFDHNTTTVDSRHSVDIAALSANWQEVSRATFDEKLAEAISKIQQA